MLLPIRYNTYITYNINIFKFGLILIIKFIKASSGEIQDPQFLNLYPLFYIYRIDGCMEWDPDIDIDVLDID